MLGDHHPLLDRRTLLEAGSISLLGLGMNHLAPLRRAAASPVAQPKARGVIYIFLSGGLSQIDSFDTEARWPRPIFAASFARSTRARPAFRSASTFRAWPSEATCGPCVDR